MTFAHDIYVCYARGQPVVAGTTIDLTAWSEKLLNTLVEEVNPNNFDLPPVGFLPAYPYTAAPAPDPRGSAPDRAAVQASALLLVLLSPALVADPARLEEIKAFREQAAQDGRTAAHVVLATIVPTPVEATRGGDLDWLLEQGNRPLNGEGFSDKDGRPVEIGLALGEGFTLLMRPIQSLAGEIRDKLKKLKRRPVATPPSPRPPQTLLTVPLPENTAASSLPSTNQAGPKPLLYLQSATDAQSWVATRDGLAPVATVNPARMAATGFGPGMRERDQERRGFLASCRALVLVRARADDPTDLHVNVALDDFRLLRQYGDGVTPDPHWLLVDWVDDDGPVLQPGIDLPRIRARAADWATQVMARL